MKDQVIKVLNKEHGKKVIEYWKNRGVNPLHIGSQTAENGSDYIYYGIIGGKFNNYCLREVKLNNAKIITLPEEKTFPRKMLCWDYNEKEATSSIVHAYVPTIESPWVCDGFSYNYAKEIPEVEEMTLEQICKELGREIKIVK